MMITTRLGLVAALSAALFACSSNDTGGSTSSSGSTGTPPPGTSGGTTSGGTSGTSGSSGASAPAAPKIDAVSQMLNVLHVKWTNPTAACDNVDAERKAEMPDGTLMEKYKVAFTVAGDIDNKMDSTATDNMKYTYRLRCKVGSQYSPYSNEASGTPKQ